MDLEKIAEAAVLIQTAQRKNPSDARPGCVDSAASLFRQKYTPFRIARHLQIGQNQAVHHIQLNLFIYHFFKGFI